MFILEYYLIKKQTKSTSHLYKSFYPHPSNIVNIVNGSIFTLIGQIWKVSNVTFEIHA